MNSLRRAQAGVMSMTMIDPDTIPLPSISALGGGLSIQDEFELDFSQVRVLICCRIHPGEMNPFIGFLSILDSRSDEHKS